MIRQISELIQGSQSLIHSLPDKKITEDLFCAWILL